MTQMKMRVYTSFTLLLLATSTVLSAQNVLGGTSEDDCSGAGCEQTQKTTTSTVGGSSGTAPVRSAGKVTSVGTENASLGGKEAVVPQQQTLPPEVAEWGKNNPWFATDPEMQRFAQSYHVALLQTQPGLSLADNLAEVTDAVRNKFKDRFQPPENPRRNAPPAVAGTGPGPNLRAAPRGWDSLPKDAKEAYGRYARMLEGKGKPFTKEEYAASYYEGE